MILNYNNIYECLFLWLSTIHLNDGAHPIDSNYATDLVGYNDYRRDIGGYLDG
jgi:hypothetical protein